MGLRFYCTRRRSTTTCLINSSIPTITGQRSIPAEPTPDNLSLEFNPGKPVLKVGSSGLPDVCSTMIAPVSKNFGVINDYGYSRCFGVEKKAKRGPHSNLILSRNYTSKSEEAEKQKLNMQMTVGNVLDFPGILFNKNRDYLVKYNGQRVYADQLAGKKPSLGALLASPERDYVISNKGDKVPIHTLEEKEVALYFYEEGYADRGKNETKVRLSQLDGKRIILFFESNIGLYLIMIYNCFYISPGPGDNQVEEHRRQTLEAGNLMRPGVTEHPDLHQKLSVFPGDLATSFHLLSVLGDWPVLASSSLEYSPSFSKVSRESTDLYFYLICVIRTAKSFVHSLTL
ncbi:hypothetical protein POM88_005906 [Heracleum sosnowskyi]|uniref:Uncharacterized protein n=1 Tax=Heracleum sosnowskyi TaxID=360622 RepID=A0AAD8J3S2_9APIA|nr:hypothetical protein POM88_005906 [Heracleum sosnowskyi]